MHLRNPVVVVALLAAIPTHADTFLSGALPDTLYLADSPFIVLSDVHVPQEASTVIEAGVEVNFTSGTRLTFATAGWCSLLVEGTSTSPVVFQGWESAGWGGDNRWGRASRSGDQESLASDC